MAWCSFARKMELQPESDSQPAIRPTQFILHSIAAPWTVKRTYEYWQSTNLESHFGLGYAGDLAQFIGTQTRADANYLANLRPDGTGAVSIETASNLKHTDPWTVAQAEQIIRLGVWLHQRHGIPLRICRTPSDPGFGYHRLFADWSTSGTACPGDARVAQFKTVVFPAIVARSADTPPSEENDMTPDESRMLKELYDGRRVLPWTYKGTDETLDAYAYLRGTSADVKSLAKAGSAVLTDAQLATLADKVAASPSLASAIAEQVADRLAARLAE